jgi:AP endonuclease-1
MSRRWSRNIDDQTEADSIDIVATPKKGRKAVKLEEIEAISQSPAKATKKRVKAEIVYEEEKIEDIKDPATIKINRVKTQAVLEEEKAPKSKKASAKRKSKAVDEEEDGDETNGNKATKKRKTKEEKEAEAMPLAARTTIASLKKAMHIGAHVSAAGGTF